MPSALGYKGITHLTFGLFISGGLRDNQPHGNINPRGQDPGDADRNPLQLDFCISPVRIFDVPAIYCLPH